MADHNSSAHQKTVVGSGIPQFVDMTDAEVTAEVNAWCTEKGVS